MYPIKRLLFLVLVIAAIVLSACGASPSAPPADATSIPATPAPAAELNRDPKTLVVADLESADNVDPAQTLNVANNLITRPIYEGLLRLKGSSLTEVEPVLAESYTTNADKSQWTFKIRQRVKFHDGASLDAQAVYDSYARTIVGKLPTWVILGRFVGEDPSKTINVVDEYTLRFTFDSPQPLFGLALASAYGTGIISPKAFKEHQKDADAGKEWLTTHAVGTGPYKLDTFAPNDQFVLVRNPNYW